MCASMMDAPTFFRVVNNKTVLRAGKATIDNVKRICTNYIDTMVKLGEAFSEVEVQFFMIERYANFKIQWVKWKRMLNRVARSNMRLSTLVELVVYPIFEKGGLFDDLLTYKQVELNNIKQKIRETHFWDMNLHRPDGCEESNCPEVMRWISIRDRVSEDAADLKKFKIVDDSNVTLDMIDTHLDYFSNLENEIKQKEPEAEKTANFIIAALEAGILEINDTIDMGRRRMLDVEVITFEETEDTMGLQIGEDDQLDESELADVVEIEDANTEAPTEQFAAVDAISEEDAGTIGPESQVDGSPVEEESSSWMKWVLIVTGVLLVLALIGGVVYMANNKRNSEFMNQQETEIDLSEMHAQNRANMQ